MAKKKSSPKTPPAKTGSSLSPELRRSIEQILLLPPMPDITSLVDRTIPKSGLALGDLIRLPEKVQSRLFKKWLLKLSSNDQEIFAQFVMSLFLHITLLHRIIEKTIRPGTPIGDLLSVVPLI